MSADEPVRGDRDLPGRDGVDVAGRDIDAAGGAGVAPAAGAGVEPAGSAAIDPAGRISDPAGRDVDAIATSEPVVVDILDHHGHATTRQRITIDAARPVFTIGRSVLADVLVDDPHVAPIHAEVAVNGNGVVSVTDRGSVNGVFVDGTRHRGARDLPVPSGRLRIGHTPIAIHTARQALPPEKPDLGAGRDGPGNAMYVATGGVIACVAIIVYYAWVSAPRDLTTQLIIGLAGSAIVAAVWIAFWTLMSRIIRGEPRWLMHAAIAFSVTAIGLVVDTLFDVARFAFALPQWASGGTSLLVLTFAIALYLHLTQVWTLRRRTGASLAAILPLLVFGTISWVQDRSEARNVNFIGVNEKVFPPSLRLRDGVTLDRYFGGASQLREDADNKRKDVPADDAGGDNDDD